MPWLLLALILEAAYLALHRLTADPAATITLLLVMGAVWTLALWLSLRSTPPLRLVLAAAVAFRLTAWFLPPALSDDVYRYRWEGKVQTAGGNPYFARPADPAWAALKDSTFDKIPGRDFHAVYGPLTLWIERAVYAVAARSGLDPFAQAFWFKAPAAVAELGSVFLIWLLLKSRGTPDRIAGYAWCPLPIVEFWGNGHNDAIAILFLAMAWWLLENRKAAASFGALSLAIAAKLWPIVLVPMFLTRGWRGAWIVPLVLAPIASPFLNLPWPELRDNFRFLSGFLGGWRNNDSLFGGLLWLASGDAYLAKRLAAAAVAITGVWAATRAWTLDRAMLTVLAVLLAVSSNVFPWYVAWLTPFVVFLPHPSLVLVIALAPLGHAPVVGWTAAGVWEHSMAERWLLWFPVYGMLLFRPLQSLSSRWHSGRA